MNALILLFLIATSSSIATSQYTTFYRWPNLNCAGTPSEVEKMPLSNCFVGESESSFITCQSGKTLVSSCSDTSCTTSCTVAAVYTPDCEPYDASTSYKYVCQHYPSIFDTTGTEVIEASTEANGGQFQETVNNGEAKRIDTKTMREIKALVAGIIITDAIIKVAFSPVILALKTLDLIDLGFDVAADKAVHAYLDFKKVSDEINGAINLKFLETPSEEQKRAALDDVSFTLANDNGTLLIGINYGDTILGYLNATFEGSNPSNISVASNYTFSYTTSPQTTSDSSVAYHFSVELYVILLFTLVALLQAT